MQIYQNMTLDDLKSGMIVTTRNGFSYLVIRNDSDFVGIRSGGWIDISRDFNADFKYNDPINDKHTWDIVKVESFDSLSNMINFEHNTKYKSVLWEEPPKVKLTIAEIENRLGYKIEIVSDNEEE